MADPLRPAQVGDVHEAVDARLELHEHAEVGDVADDARDHGPGRVLLEHLLVGVLLELLHAQGDAVLRDVDVEHDRLDLVAEVDDLLGVLDLAGPGHLGHVDEPLDALFELDERAVVLDADHLALDDGAGDVLLLGVDPRVRGDLLEAEADALGLAVELEDLDLDLVADLEQLGRMVDPAPAHVGDVQQAVDAAEIDEGAVVGEVLDLALDDLAFGETVERVGLELGALGLEQHSAREHDVAATLVELDDLEVEFLTEEDVEVADRPEIDLAAGQERLDAALQGDREAALDARLDGALDDGVLLHRALNLVPDLALAGLVLGQDDEAVRVFGVLEQDLDHVADLDFDVAVFVDELAKRDLAFGLEADVDDGVVADDVDDGALDDAAFLDLTGVLERLLEEVGEALFDELVGDGLCHGVA